MQFLRNFTAFEEVLHIITQELYGMEHEVFEYSDDSPDEQTIEIEPITILQNSSNLVQRLLIFLKEFVEQTVEPIKGLIFVKERSTARILCHVIKQYAKACPELNIHADFMTGRSSNLSDSTETALGNKNNRKVLDKFRHDQINLIVATSVLEEGIDLPACNLVIRYDTPNHFLSYVQSKGRARMKPSRYVMMVSNNEINKLQVNVNEWQKIIKNWKEVSYSFSSVMIYFNILLMFPSLPFHF